MWMILGLLVGCKSTVDVTFRLPESGAWVVEQEVKTLTRTPLGLEDLTITSTRQLVVAHGGRRGTGDLEWYEHLVRYQLDWVSSSGELHWTAGGLDPIPEPLAALAPVWRRNVFVAPDGTLYVQRLRDPPPPPDPEEEKRKARRKPPAVPEPPPEPLPDELERPRPAADSEVDAWLVGWVRAPLLPVARGAPWSWTDTQQVTLASSVQSSVSWALDRVQGDEIILTERVSMTGGARPTADAYEPVGLTGEGEFRFDAESGTPALYTAKVEADLATAFARGTSVSRTTTRFRYDPNPVLPEAPSLSPDAPESP